MTYREVHHLTYTTGFLAVVLLGFNACKEMMTMIYAKLWLKTQRIACILERIKKKNNNNNEEIVEVRKANRIYLLLKLIYYLI